MRKKQIAVYPGSFDPVTYGHIDVIKRAASRFDLLIVAVAHNRQKEPLFTVKERVALLRTVCKNIKDVKIDEFKGLLVNYCKEVKASTVIRGLRAISDFEYEFQMALTNRKLAKDVETLFLMPNELHTYLNSSIVKEIAGLKGKINSFVPPFVAKKLHEKLKKLSSPFSQTMS